MCTSSEHSSKKNRPILTQVADCIKNQLRAIFFPQPAMRLIRPPLICSYCPYRPECWDICSWFGIALSVAITQSRNLTACREVMFRVSRERDICVYVRNNANWFIDRLYQILSRHGICASRRWWSTWHGFWHCVSFRYVLPCVKQMCQSNMREARVEWAILDASSSGYTHPRILGLE